MAIKTSTFSGWRLSDKNADAFLKQVNDSAFYPLAQAALDRGKKMAEEYHANGYVTINLSHCSSNILQEKSHKA